MTAARNTIWWRSSVSKDRRTVSYVEYDEDGSRRTVIEPEDGYILRPAPVPYHWLIGWRDKQRHCMNVSLENARLAREIAPEMVSRYARMALAHYREMRKHEAEMKRYEVK